MAFVVTSLAADLVAGFAAKTPTVRVCVNRGVVDVVLRHDLASARAHFDEAIRLEPKLWSAYYDRAVVSFFEKKWQLALNDVNEAMRIKPTFTQTALLRAEINHSLRHDNEALAELDHVLHQIPMRDRLTAYALAQRAWIRAASSNDALRNGKLAIHDATTACQLSRWKSPNCLDTLAVSYAEAGDFDSASRFEEKAIELVKENPKSVMNAEESLKRGQHRMLSFNQHRRPKGSDY